MGSPAPAPGAPIWLRGPSLGSRGCHRPHGSLTGAFFLLVPAALCVALVGFLPAPPRTKLPEKGGCTWPPRHLARLPAHGRCPSPQSMCAQVPLCAPGGRTSRGPGGPGEPPPTPEPSARCGHLAAGRGSRGRKGSEARPGAASNTAVLLSFRDCLCVTARRFPLVLPRGGCRPWPRVLIPNKPALCQAALGSWGALGARGVKLPPPPRSQFLNFSKAGPSFLPSHSRCEM